MKTKLIIAAIAAIAALGVTAAFAGGGMKDADSDGDGYVSLTEMKAMHNARIEEHFAMADTNGDGLLSQDEQRAAHKGMRERHKEHRKGMRHGHDPEQIVERLDTDASGSVSLAEFGDARFAPDADSFYAADTDGNGELDTAELGAMMKAHRQERRGQKNRPDQADRPDRS